MLTPPLYPSSSTTFCRPLFGLGGMAESSEDWYGKAKDCRTGWQYRLSSLWGDMGQVDEAWWMQVGYNGGVERARGHSLNAFTK